MLTAYCMKTKTPNVPMLGVTVTRTKRNAWLAQGHDADGNKLAKVISEATKTELVATGVAREI